MRRTSSTFMIKIINKQKVWKLKDCEVNNSIAIARLAHWYPVKPNKMSKTCKI